MSSCTYHASKEAIGTCISCGKLICGACQSEIDDKSYCPPCVQKLFTTSQAKEQATLALAAAKPAIQAVNPAWWLLPVFLSWVGGLAAWLANKERNASMARYMLFSGIGMAVVQGLVGLILVIALIAPSAVTPGQKSPATSSLLRDLGTNRPAPIAQVADAKELNPFTLDYELNDSNMAFFADGDTIMTLICTTPFYAGAHALPSQKTYEYDTARVKKVAEICQEGAKIAQTVSQMKPRLASMRDYYVTYLNTVLALEPSLQGFVTEALSTLAISGIEELYVEAEYKSYNNLDISDPYVRSTMDYIQTMKAMQLGDLYLRDVENITSRAGAILVALEKHPSSDVRTAGEELDKNMKKLDTLKDDLFAIQTSMEKIDYGLKQINTGEYYFSLAADDFIMSSMPDLEAKVAALTPNESIDQEDIDFIKTYLDTIKQWQIDMKQHADTVDKSQLIALNDLPEEGFEWSTPVYARGGRDDYSSAYKSIADPARSSTDQAMAGYLSTGFASVRSGFHQAQQAVGKPVAVVGEVWGTAAYTVYRAGLGAVYGNSVKEIWTDVKKSAGDCIENVSNGTSSIKAPEIYGGAVKALETAENGAGQVADDATQAVVQTAVQKITGSKEGGKLGGWPGYLVGGLARNTVGLFTSLGKGICRLANPDSSRGDLAVGVLDIICSITGGTKMICKASQLPSVCKAAAEGGATLTKMGANLVEKMSLEFSPIISPTMQKIQQMANKYEPGVVEKLIGACTQQNAVLANELKELAKKGGSELIANIGSVGKESVKEMVEHVASDLPGVTQTIGKVLGNSGAKYLDNVFGNIADDWVKGEVKDWMDANPPGGTWATLGNKNPASALDANPPGGTWATLGNKNPASSLTTASTTNIASLTIDPSSLAGEFGKEYTFTAKTASPPAKARYEWTVDGTLQTSQTNVIKVDTSKLDKSKTGPYPITCKLYDTAKPGPYKAIAEAPAASLTIIAPLTINPSSLAGEHGKEFTFTAKTTSPPAKARYEWTVDGTLQASQTNVIKVDTSKWVKSKTGTYPITCKLYDAAKPGPYKAIAEAPAASLTINSGLRLTNCRVISSTIGGDEWLVYLQHGLSTLVIDVSDAGLVTGGCQASWIGGNEPGRMDKGVFEMSGNKAGNYLKGTFIWNVISTGVAGAPPWDSRYVGSFKSEDVTVKTGTVTVHFDITDTYMLGGQKVGSAGSFDAVFTPGGI